MGSTRADVNRDRPDPRAELLDYAGNCASSKLGGDRGFKGADRHLPSIDRGCWPVHPHLCNVTGKHDWHV